MRAKIKLAALAAIAVLALGGQAAVADAATSQGKTKRHAKKHGSVKRQTNSGTAGSTDVSSSDAGSTDVSDPNGGRRGGCRGGRRGGRHGRGGRNETPLTGETKAKAEAAAQAAYPDATIRRSETQDPNDPAGGVYEVHMTKGDGSEITVLLDESFNVVGTETGHRGPHGGEGPDGDAAPQE